MLLGNFYTQESAIMMVVRSDIILSVTGSKPNGWFGTTGPKPVTHWVGYGAYNVSVRFCTSRPKPEPNLTLLYHHALLFLQ